MNRGVLGGEQEAVHPLSIAAEDTETAIKEELDAFVAKRTEEGGVPV